MSINRVVLIGRMVRDAELRTTTGGKSVAAVTIAVDKRIKPTDGSPTADFFNVTAWDKTAEFITNYLGKGRLIAVEGRLQSRKYTAKDGSEREIVEIVADNVQGLDRPKDDPQPKGKAAQPSVDEYDPFADE